MALEDAGGSGLGFVILILILIESLVFDTPMFRILVLYLDFESAKNIHVLSPDLGLWGILKFLTWVLYLDLDLDMVIGL